MNHTYLRNKSPFPSSPTKDQMILNWSFRTSSISQSLKKVNEMTSSNSSDIPPGSPKKGLRGTGDWNWLKRSSQHTRPWGLRAYCTGRRDVFTSFVSAMCIYTDYDGLQWVSYARPRLLEAAHWSLHFFTNSMDSKPWFEADWWEWHHDRYAVNTISPRSFLSQVT